MPPWAFILISVLATLVFSIAVSELMLRGRRRR